MSAASNVRLGPGPGEIVLGSILSVVLGALLAALFLAARPMKVVKEVPEEAEANVVYFVEGRKDYEASRRWMFKRDVFVQGQSVEVTAGELNYWVGSVYPPPAKDAPNDAIFSVGTPQFNIADDELKAGVLCRLNVFTLVHEIAVQTAGGFVKTGETYEFRPREVRVGGLPAHKLGPLGQIIFKQIAGAFVPPEDVAAAWAKLNGVHVEGNVLVLAGP
jgi:hypothetical protein